MPLPVAPSCHLAQHSWNNVPAASAASWHLPELSLQVLVHLTTAVAASGHLQQHVVSQLLLLLQLQRLLLHQSAAAAFATSSWQTLGMP